MKKGFTDIEVAKLSKNKYIKTVSNKAITYTDEFKEIFIAESRTGKSTRIIFEEYGFDTEILGKDRYDSAGKRWRSAYNKNGILGIQDNRKKSSGRPLKRNLSAEEKLARIEAENILLKAENELLKKVRLLERGMI